MMIYYGILHFTGLRHPDDVGPAVLVPVADDAVGPGPQLGRGRRRLQVQGAQRLGRGQRHLPRQSAR